MAPREVNNAALALLGTVQELEASSSAEAFVKVWLALDGFSNFVRKEFKHPPLEGRRGQPA